MALSKTPGQGLGLIGLEFINLGAPGVLRDRGQVGLRSGIEPIGAIRTNGGGGKEQLRPKLAVRLLEPQPERIPIIPVYQEHIVVALPVGVDHLDGASGTREWHLHRFSHRAIRLLAQNIEVRFGEQQQVLAAVSVKISRRQGVRSELAVIQRPAFWWTPAA